MKLLLMYFCIMFYSVSLYADDIRTLKVAIYLDPPYVDYKNNQYIGEDIDLLIYLAKKSNMQIEYIRCPIARCLYLVKEGVADMVMQLKKTPERIKDYLFLQPATFIQEFPLNFYINKGLLNTIQNYQDLTGLKIGVIRGMSYFDRFDKDTELLKVKVNNREQLVGMLKKGRIDTFLDRDDAMLPILNRLNSQGEINKAKFKFTKYVKSYLVISKKTDISTYSNKLSHHLKDIVKIKQNTANKK